MAIEYRAWLVTGDSLGHVTIEKVDFGYEITTYPPRGGVREPEWAPSESTAREHAQSIVDNFMAQAKIIDDHARRMGLTEADINDDDYRIQIVEEGHQ